MTRYALIDYGYGVAQLWGDFNRKTVEDFFYRHAGQCFGIRKSIIYCKVRELKKAAFPDVFGVRKDDMAALLKHSGDTIAWNHEGEKIRSEWD